MIKKFLNAFLVGALFLCALGTVSSCTDYDDDISALSDRIDDLESSTSVSISSLSSQISSINSTISSLQSDLSSQISSLTSDLAALGIEVDDLETYLNTSLTSLESTLKAYVDAGDASILSNLEANYYTKTELDAMFLTVNNAIAAEKAEREAAISGINESLATINEANAGFTASIADLLSEVELLWDSDANLNDKVDACVPYVEFETARTNIQNLSDSLKTAYEEIALLWDQSYFISSELQTGYVRYVEFQAAQTQIESILEDIEALYTATDDLYATTAGQVSQRTVNDLIDQVGKIEDAVAALQTTVGNIQSDLQSSIDALATQIETINTTLTNFGARITAIEEGADAWFGESFAKYVAAYGLVDTTFVNTAINSLSEEINTTIDDLQEYVDYWFDDIYAYANDITFALASAEDRLNLAIEDLEIELKASIEEVKAAADAYYEELTEKISALDERVTALEDALTLDETAISGLDASLTSLKNEVAEIWAALEEVQGRIQSLVYAPSNVSGIITFPGNQYVKAYSNIANTGYSSTVYLLRAAQTSHSTATFYVTPKALADDLLDSDVWELSIIQYEATKATDTYVTVDLENSTYDLEEGTITLSLASTYPFSSSSKTLMIALHAEKKTTSVETFVVDDSATATETEETYGSSYTTNFIQIGSENKDLTSNFALVRNNGYRYVAVGDYTANVQYTTSTTEQIGFFPGYEMRFYDEDEYEYITFAEAAAKYEWTVATPTWNSEVSEAIVLDQGTASSLVAANYSYPSAVADQTYFSLAKNDEAMIGNTVKGSYNFYVTVGGKYITKAVTDTRTITDEPIIVEQGQSSSFVWDYVTAISGTPQYVGADYQITTASDEAYTILSDAATTEYKVYKGSLTYAQTLTASEYTKFTASVAFKTYIGLDGTGLMSSGVTLNGDISEAGNYTVVASVTSTAGHVVAAVCPITITGIPAAVTVDLGEIKISYPTYYTLENNANIQLTSENTSGITVNPTTKADYTYIELAWAKLTEAQQAQYGEFANFESYLKASEEPKSTWTTYTEGAPYLSSSVYSGNSANLYVRQNGTAYVLDKTYSVQGVASYAWSNDGVTTKIATYKATFTITSPSDKLTTDALYYNTTDNSVTIMPYIVADGGSHILGYTGNDLTKAVYYAGEDAYEVTYAITETIPTTFTGNVPAITDGVLSWNDWDELELEVTATLSYAGIVSDKLVFTAKLIDPVVANNFAFNGGEPLVVPVGSNKVTVNIYRYPVTVTDETGTEVTTNEILLTGVNFNSSMDQGLFTKGESVFFYNASNSTRQYGLRPSVENAIDAELTYTVPTLPSGVTFENGLLTVSATALVVNDYTITIPVTYSDRFNEAVSTNIVFTLTPAATE